MKTNLFLLFILPLLFSPLSSSAQTTTLPQTPNGLVKEKEEGPKAPDKVEVKPTARDHEIEERLEGILNATGWFVNPQVEVQEGVVFLNGKAKTEEYKEWATQLARNTQDVSAVVNQLDLVEPSAWDFHPVIKGLQNQWRGFLKALPSLFSALIIMVLTWFLASFTTKVARKTLAPRIASQLLLEIVARTFGFLLFILGLYLIFRVLGLTTVALTVIGGTGLLGIAIGIAFRDISENLLASIFLSIHNPFRSGDLIEIGETTGYVQRLTIRSTVLINLSGHLVQIPNATVYKSEIRNFSANPNRQETVALVISDKEDIPRTQEVAMKVLTEHPAVLKDPEPWVLVDNIEETNVTLKIYFWIDGSEHSWLKVRSSVLRLIKRSFQSHAIHMPSQAHEITLSSELLVRLLSPEQKVLKEEKKASKELAPLATDAEGELKSDSEEIEEQARQSRPPPEGEKDLLPESSSEEGSKTS